MEPRLTESESLLLARGSMWAVVGKSTHADCVAVRLRGVQAHNVGQVRTLLSPFDRLRPITGSKAWRVLQPRRWLDALRAAALHCHPFGGLRGADDSHIDLLPYQLEPVLAMLRHGATRVLIADDVGLGKTVQAGLALSEFAARVEGFRALVVMPAALRDQWRQELQGHFALDTIRADAGWLAAITRTLPQDLNPWALPGIYLTSFDFLKRAEVLRPLEDVTWDVVIVDEAHAAAPSTGRRAAIHAVACRGRRVILLTATPHSGDAEQFRALCDIGAIQDRRSGEPADALVMFRRSRMDTGTRLRRRTVLLSVRPSPAERRMHRILERYAAAIQTDSRRGMADPHGLLAAVVLRKRGLSSAGSLLASTIRREQLLAGAVAPEVAQLFLPLGDEDPLDDATPGSVLAAAGLSDGRKEQQFLAAITRAARKAAREETKARFLLRLLRRVHEPVIVFTEYRDTLTRLAELLAAAGHAVETLHGGMTADERHHAQRQFNAGGCLLLATDAASEGLNLHHRCRLVIHYELPWAPMRLQQRAGRVDRIGQKKRVHEILLVADDTAERLVLAPLARRISEARDATAGGAALFDALSESRVSAAVFAGDEVSVEEPDPPPADNTTRIDLRSAARDEVNRLVDRRQWHQRLKSQPSPPRGRFVATFRRRRESRQPTATIIFRLSLRSPGGNSVHSEVIPIELPTRGAVVPARHAAIREAAEHLVGKISADRASELDAIVRSRTEMLVELHRAVIRAACRREGAIALLAPSAAQYLVQAGLFDRRALMAAGIRRRARGELLEDAAGRIDGLGAAEAIVPSLEIIGLLVPGR